MLLHKDGITYDITDATQVTAFLGSGWSEVNGGYAYAPNEPTGLDALSDDQLKQLADEHEIDTTRIKSRTKLIAALHERGIME